MSITTTALGVPSDAPLVFLDTETTSLRHDRQVWEVAAIRVEPTPYAPGEVLHEYVRCGDLRLQDADPESLRVGGFYQRHPECHPTVRRQEPYPPQWHAPSSERHVAEVIERHTRGAILVGINVAFDAEALTAMLVRHNLRPAWHYRSISVEQVAAGWVLNGRALALERGDTPAASHFSEVVRTPWSSQFLSRALGVEPPMFPDWHTALGDARWARRLWDGLTDPTRLSGDGGDDVSDTGDGDEQQQAAGTSRQHDDQHDQQRGGVTP